MDPYITYNILINRLEEFIRKYLRNKLIRGLLISGGFASTYFLLASSIEFYAYLPSKVRLGVLLGFLMLMAYITIYQIIIPAYRLIYFRKFMSHNEAARIIGQKLPEVSDKLLNLLQLGENAKLSTDDNTLLLSAIKQKSESLILIPFTSAIDLSITKKVFRWSIVPILILIFLLLLYPTFVVSPTSRIVRYNTVFEKPLPFTVRIESEPLEVVHNEDYELKILVRGQEIPNEFYLLADGMRISMSKNSTISFTHTFRKVNRDIKFRIIGGDYQSPELVLSVRARPRLLGYTALLEFPQYIKRQGEKLVNPALISVPVGTKISWVFNTKDVNVLRIVMDSAGTEPIAAGNIFNHEMTATKNGKMQVFGGNRFMENESLVLVNIDVIKDEYPTILVNDLQEEEMSRKRFFSGFITDDYGFSALKVMLSIDKQTQSSKEDGKVTKDLFLQVGQLRQNFYYALDLDSLNLTAGEKIVLQFSVSDNDFFGGPKTVLSQAFNYQIPSHESLDSIRRKQERSIERKMEALQMNVAALKKEIQNMSRRLLSKAEPDQNDRAMLNQLVKQQISLQEQMDQLRKDRENINRFNRENDLLNEKLLQKQAMVDQLVKEIIPEDLRKMMEDLERLLEKINKDQLSDLLKKMEMSNDQMEKMLDRNLSLLKQLQFEKEMNALLDRLDRLSNELEKNAEATLNIRQELRQEVSRNLEEIREKFIMERERLDTLRRDNKRLEQPFALNDTDDEENAIQNEMKEGQEMLDKKDNKGSASKQQKAAEGMKKLKDQLESMMNMSEEEQLAEDARMIRYLLENVLRISFQQENLTNKLIKLRRDDPAYSLLVRNQSMLLESFRVVDDSLTALARRQPMVGNFVLNEVATVKSRISDVQEKMKERLNAEAAASQQYAMMSLNNLALMLAESLKNMEENMGMSASGKGKSKRPKPGDAMQKMREMQEKLGKQLQEMMKGNQKGQGKTGMSEEIARMAAQQEAIRQKMRSLMDQLKSEGLTGDGGLNKVLEDMEKMEERLVNKYIDEQTLRLQRNIEVRMLDSEKALKEREMEERRESFEYKGENMGNLIENKEYNKIMKLQQDMLYTSPIDLLPFFRERSRSYFIRLNERP